MTNPVIVILFWLIVAIIAWINGVLWLTAIAVMGLIFGLVMWKRAQYRKRVDSEVAVGHLWMLGHGFQLETFETEAVFMTAIRQIHAYGMAHGSGSPFDHVQHAITEGCSDESCPGYQADPPEHTPEWFSRRDEILNLPPWKP